MKASDDSRLPFCGELSGLTSAEFADRYIPANRVGKVEEIAPLFLFLASDEAAWITGQTFVIDGGQLAGQKLWPGLLQEIEL